MQCLLLYVGVMNEPERLEPLHRAAEYTGVSARTVQRWIAGGLLTSYRYRVGPYRVKVDLDEIDSLSEPSISKAG